MRYPRPGPWKLITATERPEDSICAATAHGSLQPVFAPYRRVGARLSGDPRAVGRCQHSRLRPNGRSASRIFIHCRARGKRPQLPRTAWSCRK